MIERPCPLCGDTQSVAVFAEANLNQQRLGEFSFSSRKLPEYMHHRLLICSSCDLVFASPLPDLTELHSAYARAAFDSHAESTDAARTYARLIGSLLRTDSDRDAALDIGCGDGAFLQQLLALGFRNVRGIEPSAAPIAAAKPQLRGLIEQGLFEPGRFSAGSLALVTCFQTIEHVPDPLQLCREAARLLKPGGILCLIGHNRRAVSARVLGTKSPIYDVEHLQLFSRHSFQRLLSAAGLSIVRIAPFWNCYSLSYWTRLFPFPNGVKSCLQKVLAVTGTGRLSISLPAGNLLAVGRKVLATSDES